MNRNGQYTIIEKGNRREEEERVREKQRSYWNDSPLAESASTGLTQALHAKILILDVPLEALDPYL